MGLGPRIKLDLFEVFIGSINYIVLKVDYPVKTRLNKLINI
jgi:hypothetical protein